MALQILENNGTFHLEGNLNASTSKSFLVHFEHIIKALNSVTLNIDKLKEIDANGVSAIKALFTSALRDNKLFYVVGNGCKDIYEEFRYTNVA